MTATNAQLNSIYDSTNGRCHICWKKLSFDNHGLHGAKGAWPSSIESLAHAGVLTG